MSTSELRAGGPAVDVDLHAFERRRLERRVSKQQEETLDIVILQYIFDASIIETMDLSVAEHKVERELCRLRFERAAESFPVLPRLFGHLPLLSSFILILSFPFYHPYHLGHLNHPSLKCLRSAVFLRLSCFSGQNSVHLTTPNPVSNTRKLIRLH